MFIFRYVSDKEPNFLETNHFQNGFKYGRCGRKLCKREEMIRSFHFQYFKTLCCQVLPFIESAQDLCVSISRSKLLHPPCEKKIRCISPFAHKLLTRIDHFLFLKIIHAHKVT